MTLYTSKKVNRTTLLRDRALMLARVREFFAHRGVMEVDTPILSAQASVDAFIDLIPANYSQNETRYLHSSPEFCMKRLLSEGSGDIYQLSHVFRDGEHSLKHNPEFTMVEWYRVGFSLDKLIHETIDLIRLFLGDLPVEVISYREAFKKYVNIDYVTATVADLRKFLESQDLITDEQDKNNLLDIILTTFIEPHFGQNGLTVLNHYPSTMAALAKTFWKNDEHVAERYEIYYHSVELCNGYHELTNPEEQEIRFIQQNDLRDSLGKSRLPIDYNFLEALKKGLPSCSGVAVGFDRLMMLRHHTKDISEILSFPWPSA